MAFNFSMDPNMEEWIRRKSAQDALANGDFPSLGANPYPDSGPAPAPVPNPMPPPPPVAPPVPKYADEAAAVKELENIDAEKRVVDTQREFQNGMDRAQAFFTKQAVPARYMPPIDDSVRKFILTRKLGMGAKPGEAPVTDAEVAALVKAGIDPSQAQALRVDPGTFRKTLADHLGYRKPGEEKTPMVQHEEYVRRGAALKRPVLPTMGEKPADFAKRVESQEQDEAGGDKKISDAGKSAAVELRKEFNGLPEVKNFTEVATMRRKIDSASDTGVGDLGLVYAYMKLLDPGSSVREGEYANAAQTGSVPQSLVTAYNRIVAGDKLSPENRARFKGEAEKVYESQKAEYDLAAEHFTGLANRMGLSPEDIVRPRGVTKTKTGPAPRPGDDFLPKR
jgi:hypothetical protein